jgi:hypothetical protein
MCRSHLIKILKLAGVLIRLSMTLTFAEFCSRLDPKKNPIVSQYVLPDFSINQPGYLLDPATSEELPKDVPILFMGNERFSIPEILFHPSHVGQSSPIS